MKCAMIVFAVIAIACGGRAVDDATDGDVDAAPACIETEYGCTFCIEDAATKHEHFRMHVVLGVKSHDDTRRLEALLAAAAERGGSVAESVVLAGEYDDQLRALPEPKRYSVAIHPMYSQDFFSVYREELLF